MKEVFIAVLLTLPLAACTENRMEHSARDKPAKARPPQKNAGQMFEDRFTWNEVFSCSRNGNRLAIAVGETFGRDAARIGMTDAQRIRSLDIDVFHTLKNGHQQRWFHS